MRREIPRGVEVLVKKAAVDPSFKKLLLQRRAESAQAIALTLSPAEEAMLAAVPEAQLRAIVASTKVSPSLRPAFLGYAAAAMLAALSVSAARATADHNAEQEIITSTGIRSETAEGRTEVARIVFDYYGVELTDNAGVVAGTVIDQRGDSVTGVLIAFKKISRFATSDTDGIYYLADIPPGKYKVTASRVGFIKKTCEIEVKTGTLTEFTFILASEPCGGIRPDVPSEKGE
ncbi:MAG: carboxypeptidase regulatory-like domain-containing protein [Candidatus Coatesbacteria bacterium]|nr:MAG: carboxypeptidase regulatory-like domain-containing protein [Candidatus Coatesbacteria bacterium]